jgi:glycogen phosphorylase
MRESMARLAPRYSADRAVRDYTEQHYLPAANSYLQRTAGKGLMGSQILAWQNALNKNWGKLRFVEVKVDTLDGQYFFEVQISLYDFDPKSVRVELYAEGIMGGGMPFVRT